MTKTFRVSACALWVPLVACGGAGSTVDGDMGGSDAARDASTHDAGLDAAHDAGSDAAHDAGSDAGQDAGNDAAHDAGSDAGQDAGSDAGHPDSGVPCSASQMPCHGSCVNTVSNDMNCGACDRVCDHSIGEYCAESDCRPSNDLPSGAIEVDLSNGREFTLNGTTAHARAPSSPVDTGGCGSLAGADVWYKVFVTDGQNWIVYADTSGTTAVDTALYFTDSGGTLIPSAGHPGLTCNLDSCGGNTAHIGTTLTYGFYYIGVATQSGADGAFTLHIQSAYFNTFRFNSPVGFLAGTGATPDRSLSGTVFPLPTCTSTGSDWGEDAYWFMSCGTQADRLSLCQGDGGYWTGGSSGTDHNPVLTTYTPSQATSSREGWIQDMCNNNVSSCWAQAASHSTNSYGSRLNTTFVRGLNVVSVDDDNGTGMHYSLEYSINP